MAQQYGKVVMCDYSGCDEYQVIPLEQEEAGMGWGQTPDGKDLCADHWQYYCDALAEFWGDQPAPKHAGTTLHLDDGTVLDEQYNVISTEEADRLVEEVSQPTESLEPIKDEDILYTNMPEMNTIKVTGPSGTVEGHIQEDW